MLQTAISIWFSNGVSNLVYIDASHTSAFIQHTEKIGYFIPESIYINNMDHTIVKSIELSAVILGQTKYLGLKEMRGWNNR